MARVDRKSCIQDSFLATVVVVDAVAAPPCYILILIKRTRSLNVFSSVY